MTILDSSAERFAALFRGYEHAHGRYEFKRGSDDNGKVGGRPYTVGRAFSVSEVKDHLSGEAPGLGSVPLLEDETCVWAALDIDDKLVNQSNLARKCKALNLPVVVCRSKSGGAHVYVFFSEPEPASEVRDRLGQWSAALGYGGCEVFPKQDARANKDDLGNWINLPYYSAGQTLRPAYNEAGEVLTLEEFLDYAEKMRGPLPEAKATSGAADSDPKGLLEEGPPCLIHILNGGGFGDGSRNEGMFNVAVYLRKRYAEAWEQHLAAYNAEFCSPQLSISELHALAKSVTRKDYGYRCSQPPIKPFCQKRTCLRRRYGVGNGENNQEIDIGGLTKYETGNGRDVRWGLEVGGKRLMVDTSTLYDVHAFNRACMAACGRIPVSMPPARWRSYLDRLLQSADVVQLPEDASQEGQLWLWVVQFLTQRAHAKTIDEVSTGRPYHDEGRVLFRSSDLFNYLRTFRVPYESETTVFLLLKEKGADKKYYKIKREGGGQQGVNLWSLPLPEGAEAPTGMPVEQLGQEAF